MNIKTDLLLNIALELKNCQRCALAEHRSRIVFGSGNPNAQIVFLGEAPGKDEDESGMPFVGRAGKLLTKMIESIGLMRDEVYICNVVKCRPEDNRNPIPGESSICMEFLHKQLEIINPHIIVVMGKVAAAALTLKNLNMQEYRELNPRIIGHRNVIYTYHPAYLLRSPHMKKEAWKDLQIIKEML
jgi:DNA polymerase